MPQLVRIGDAVAPHSDFAGSVMATGSTKVFIQGVGACRVGDISTVHCNPYSCHIGTDIVGSTKILIEGSPALLVGDSLDCGAVVIGGSSKVTGN